MSEVDRRAHDARVVDVFFHAEHEALVDLQLVDRQLLQVGERRVTGAEVVDRQLEAQARQALQRVHRTLRVVHDRALGDLQAEGFGRHDVLDQQGLELLRQLHVEQVAGREVDRDDDAHATFVEHTPHARRLFEHPHGQHADEARLLGKRDETHRRHQPACRVLPAQQRFGADDATSVERELGLQVQAQLVVVDGVAQLAQQRQRLRAGGVDGRVVEHRAFAAALGVVHRHLGAAEQGVGVGGMVRPHRHAEARAHVDGVVFEHHHVAKGLVQALRDGGGVGQVARGLEVSQQHRKLVTAQAGHQVAVAHGLLRQALGHALQHEVAEAVAEHVVHVFEAVEVEHHHGDGAVVGLADGHRLDHRVAELQAVGQAGEAVPIRELEDLFLLPRHAHAHAFEGLGQVADLVVAALAAERRGVVAGAQALGSRGEAAQGRGDVARGEHAAHAEHHHAEHGEHGQAELQPLVGRHGFVHRTHQHGRDGGTTGLGERDGAGTVFAIGQGEAHGRVTRQEDVLPLERAARRLGQRGDGGLPR